jgi:threonine/homoserine/homoserine lactone efflux protein
MDLPVDPAKYAAFLVAMFFMAISPGPANLFFIRTGLSGSYSRVFAGVAGTNSASAMWFVASALGLQLLMTAFPLVFQVVAVLGGLYVGWLGIRTIRKAMDMDKEALGAELTTVAPVRTRWQTLREGFMVQALNPKMVLFLSAVLPPFVDIRRPMPAQMLVFAATTIGMDVVSMTSYGLGAVTLSRFLSHPRNRQRFDLGAGGILVMIGVIIVLHTVLDFIKPH